MVVEVAALLVESVSAAVTILGEIKRRRSNTSGLAILTALPKLNFESALEGVTDARFAGLMRGAMTAEHSALVTADIQVGRIMSEMVLATVVEDQEESIHSIAELLIVRTQTLLDGRVSSDDATYFARGLAQLTREFCTEVLKSALEVEPDSVIGIQQLSVMKRTHAILQRVGEQLEAVNRTASEAVALERRTFIAEYRSVCAAVHGVIQPPDFETNQRIPLEDLYVAPIIKPAQGESSVEWEPDQFSKHIDRTVLLGDPGGGKSTLSNFLTMRWARDDRGPVPFHVILREFAPESETLSILEFIESRLPSRYQIQTSAGAVEDCLLSGNAVVVFDGLDELIDPTKRRAMTSAVETFAFRYPMVRIFVTSRRVGYEQARLDPALFDSYLIDGFNREDVRTYVERWFASQSSYSEAEAEALSRQFMSQSRAVEDLSSNPLMLSLMCIIFRGENFIPRNRPAIYEKCANLLFEKWDGHRQIEVPLQARDYVDVAMKHVAFVFLESGAGDTGIARAELVREMTAYLFPRAMETRDAAQRAAEEFVDFCAGRAWVFSDAGTTADGEPIFTFTHRTFMEYFAAVHLIRISDTPEKLASTLLPRIAREEWDVVAQLAVQQCDRSHDRGSERALRRMLEDNRRRSDVNRARILQFIVRCCEFAIISPALLRQISANCCEFYLASTVDSEAAPDTGLSTVLSLQEFVPEDQLEPVIAVQHESLLDVLGRPEDPRFDNAVFLALLALVRRFNGRVWRPDERSHLWDEMFQTVATSRLPELTAVVENDPTGWVTLLVGGVVEPAVAIGNMKRAGLTFSQIYCKNSIVLGMDVSGASLLAMMASAVSNNEGPDHLKDLPMVEEVARAFLADFWDPNRSRVLLDADMSYGTPGVRPNPETAARRHYSTQLRDFWLIAALAMDEVHQVTDGHSRFRMGTQPIKEANDVRNRLGELGLSKSAKKFGRAWFDDQSSAFDRIELSQENRGLSRLRRQRADA